MYNKIADILITEQDRKNLQEEIEMLLASLYKDHGGEFDNVLQNSLRESTASAIKEAMSRSKTDKAAFLKGLLEELEKYETLNLTIARELPKKSMDKIFQWVRTNVGEYVLLDVAINSSQVAGAVISFKGKYKDYSFEKLYLNKFSKDTEAINSFLDKGGGR